MGRENGPAGRCERGWCESTGLAVHLDEVVCRVSDAEHGHMAKCLFLVRNSF